MPCGMPATWAIRSSTALGVWYSVWPETLRTMSSDCSKPNASTSGGGAEYAGGSAGSKAPASTSGDSGAGAWVGSRSSRGSGAIVPATSSGRATQPMYSTEMTSSSAGGSGAGSNASGAGIGSTGSGASAAGDSIRGGGGASTVSAAASAARAASGTAALPSACCRWSSRIRVSCARASSLLRSTASRASSQRSVSSYRARRSVMSASALSAMTFSPSRPSTCVNARSAAGRSLRSQWQRPRTMFAGM